MGRPSKYSASLVDEICKRLSEGESLNKICAEDEMPSTVTIWTWLDKYPEFLTKYARAREAQAEFYASEIINIADEEPKHFVPDPDGGESERIDSAGIARNRLRVDARKWVASKLLPKKYGDKIQQEVSGPDGKAIQAEVRIEFVRTKNINGD